MRSCKHWMWAFLFCLFATAVGNCAATIKNSFAGECGVDADQPAQRTFADAEGKNTWREYKTPKDVPQMQSSGYFAQSWTASSGNVFIRMEEPNEDWFTYTDYCFNKIGRLIALRFEVRTAWGWGHRESGPIVKGAFKPRTSDFFNTGNEVTIARPEQAEDFVVELKPHIYIRKSQLPFAKLLSK